MIKRLESAGYVQRKRDETDERRVLVAVTPLGDELQERVAHVPRDAWQDLGLAPDEALQLRGLLDRVLARLDATSAS